MSRSCQPPPPRLVTTLAYSADRMRLAAGCYDGRIRIYKTDTGRQCLELADDGEAVLAVAFGRDDTRLIAGDKGGTLEVWDPRSGTSIARWKGHEGEVRGVAFGGAGLFVSVGEDGACRLWTPDEVHEVWRLDGSSGLCAVTFDPRGTFVATGSEDGVLTRIDLTSGRIQYRVEAHAGAILEVPGLPCRSLF